MCSQSLSVIVIIWVIVHLILVAATTTASIHNNTYTQYFSQFLCHRLKSLSTYDLCHVHSTSKYSNQQDNSILNECKTKHIVDVNDQFNDSCHDYNNFKNTNISRKSAQKKRRKSSRKALGIGYGFVGMILLLSSFFVAANHFNKRYLYLTAYKELKHNLNEDPGYLESNDDESMKTHFNVFRPEIDNKLHAKFWLYAATYGEDLARQYYGESESVPPVGSIPSQELLHYVLRMTSNDE